MGGECVHVTCMLSKFSARHAGSHRKCVLPRVLGRQGPQSGAQRSSWTLRPEERGCWSCKATWTQSRVTWRQGPETRKQAPPPRREHRMGVGHRGGACGCRFKGPGAEGGPTKPSWTPSLAFPAPCGAQYQLPFDWNFLGGTSVVCIQRITDQIREKHYFQISIIKHPKELSKYLL